MAESLNICVVDDDRDVAEGLAEILELAGHRVQTAFSGQDAFRILEQTDFDIAFLNANLPDQTRLESFMQLRKVKPEMQAVMMTGYTIEQLLRQAVQDGSVSVLQRPVAMDEVLRALEAAKPQGVVLVAEDDPNVRHKISDTLALQDYQVGIARTVGDALDMVYANECDILVLDLQRPVIDALEVYLELEKNDRALPTIVISEVPDADSGPIDLLRDQGITGVLVKPFDPARLLGELAKMQERAAETAAEEPEVESHPSGGYQGRILVIDDDRDLADGLGDVLRDLGHTVEIAFNGSDALEIAKRFDAQIALVDIKLGRASGLELISSLKELRPDIVNVVITANAGKESVIAALRSGAFDFLNKPMHPQDLFVILDRCFEHIHKQGHQTKPSNEASSEFASAASHELRDPLNAVIGFSEILGDEMMGPLGSDQYLYYAKGINEAGQHLTSVIDDMFESAEKGAQATDSQEPTESATSPLADDKRPTAAPALDTSAADLAGGDDTGHVDPATGNAEAWSPQPENPPYDDSQYLAPAPLAVDPGQGDPSTLPPRPAPLAEAPVSEPNPDAFPAAEDAAPRETDPAGFEPAQPAHEDPDPAETRRIAAYSAADTGYPGADLSTPTSPPHEEIRPPEPEADQPMDLAASTTSGLTDRSWPGEPETEAFALDPTAPGTPSTDWPERDERPLAGSDQPELETSDLGTGDEISNAAPTVEATTASSPPSRGERPDPEPEAEDGSEEPDEDREQKILRFSLKKVI